MTTFLVGSRAKLAEARFFLEKLEGHKPDLEGLIAGADIIPDEVSYYLSAFISAARSVSWFLRFECANVAGWEEWYGSYPLSSEDRHLLNSFNDLRIQTVKRSPLHPGLLLGAADSGAMQEDAGVTSDPPQNHEYTINVLATGQDGIAKAVPVDLTSLGWGLDNLEGEVLESCVRYVSLLQHLLDACEQAFAGAH